MNWTAPIIERSDPPATGPERVALQGWLTYQRETLLTKCGGLTHSQLAKCSVEPSSMSLLGIVRHMTDVERWWFRINVRGESVSPQYWTDADPDGDFNDLQSVSAREMFSAYAAECLLADAAVVDLSLDHRFLHSRHREQMDLRWVYIHMIEEYARHNGHADLLREQIDGVTGD